MRFSKEVKDSPTLKLGEIAREKIKNGEKIISLALGEPDFETPRYIIDATKKALDDGFTHYSTPQGLIELREAISKDYKNKYNANYEASEIIIFPGAKAAIFAAISVLLKPGDEVIIISPYYVSYPPMIKLAEYESKINVLPLNKDLSLPIDKIKETVNENTKVLILNYPNNPTGKLMTEEEVEEIIKLIKSNNNLHLISDEIYDNLTFSNKKFKSFSSFKEIKDRTIIINGYSKTYAMTGFRVGYALSSKEIIRKMNLFNQNTNTNTNTFVQRGCLSIYENENTHLKEYNNVLRKRAEYLHKAINDIPYLSGTKPEGGFYYFVNIEKTNMKSLDFSNYLIDKHGIVLTPGIAFGIDFDNYVRVSLSVKLEVMKEAIRILKSLSF